MQLAHAWKSSRQLLPIITNRGISLKNLGSNFSSCIRKSWLYGWETWPACSEILHRLTSAENGMVRWICSVWLEQCIRTQELHEKLGIISVTEEIWWCRLRYFGHLRRMVNNVWPRRINDYTVTGNLPRGRLQLRWSDALTKDLKDLNIRKEIADERAGWQRAIMLRKIQLQRVLPIRRGQVL